MGIYSYCYFSIDIPIDKLLFFCFLLLMSRAVVCHYVETVNLTMTLYSILYA